MATVYLAISRGLAGFNKLVVLKQLRPEVASDPDFLPMLLEEARIAARINHPNVVQTNEIGFDGRAHFIAMEYLEGQTLHEITRRLAEQGRRLPLPLYLHILSQALRGLHCAHELTDYDGSPLSIVHRDMTPHNVFITYDGVVKVLDFGIAKAADTKNETRSGTFKGKLRYIAPEQALGIHIDRRADIFAIGVMMWHALTGSRLWKDVSETDVLMQLAKGEIPSIAAAAPKVSPELVTLCARALAHRPDDRFATAAEMMDAFEAYLAQTEMLTPGRELAQFVSQLFEERRNVVRAAIDQRVREGLSGDDIPLLAASDTKLAPGASKPSMPSVPSVPSVPSMSGSRSFPRSVGSISLATGSNAAVIPARSAPVLPEVTEPVSPVRRHALGAILGLLVAGVGFGAYKMMDRNTVSVPAASAAPGIASTHGAASAQATQANAAITAEAGPSAAPLKSRLRVSVTPNTATIRLDGAPFSGEGSIARDGASHRLEISAPGFKSESDYVVFDRDELTLTYTLGKKDSTVWRSAPRSAKNKERDAARAAVAETAPVPPPPAAPATAASGAPPQQGQKRKASLDSADPWK
ncbi:serine/threonine protein kinase [Pendulispora albinea]|uniref:non-specific serine/threonine protein kinase n=2 Tax=Pendulispora albinea TaxID=2741071 RepID=A0ABZ2LKE4_9BACT